MKLEFDTEGGMLALRTKAGVAATKPETRGAANAFRAVAAYVR
jgi:hypothetical protein